MPSAQVSTQARESTHAMTFVACQCVENRKEKCTGPGLENTLRGPLYFQYFRLFKKSNGQPFSGQIAQRLYNSYITAHAPGQHMWQGRGPGPYFKCSKTVEVRCSFQELKPCQGNIDTGEIQEGGVGYKEHSNVKVLMSVY